MTIYYVRKVGDDAKDGRSPANAWASVTHALNVAQAGDTVYIGAGLYRGKLVLPRSGSAGSPIRLIGDPLGRRCGDQGLVLISPHTDRWCDLDYWQHWFTTAMAGIPYTNQPVHTLNLNARTYVEFESLLFLGSFGDTVHNRSAPPYATAAAFSGAGVIFTDCILGGAAVQAQTETLALDVHLRALTGSVSGAGFTLRRCALLGMGVLQLDELDTPRDLNLRVESCLDFGGLQVDGYANAVGRKVWLLNNTLYAPTYQGMWLGSGLEEGVWANQSDVWVSSSADDYVHTARNQILALCGDQYYPNAWEHALFLAGAVSDLQLRQYNGFSPYLPFAPYDVDVPGHFIGTLQPAGAEAIAGVTMPDRDFYRNPSTSSAGWLTTWVDGSVQAVTDHTNNWTNDAYAVRNDTSSVYMASAAAANAQLSASGIYTHFDDIPGDENTTLARRVMVTARIQRAASAFLQFVNLEISSQGEVLLSSAVLATRPMTLGAAYYLTAPAGGWTRAKLRALKWKFTTQDANQAKVGPVLFHIPLVNALAFGAMARRPSAVPDLLEDGSQRLALASQGIYRLVRILRAGSYTVATTVSQPEGYAGPPPRLTVDLPVLGTLLTATPVGGAGSSETIEVSFTVPDCTLMIATLENVNNSGKSTIYFDNLTLGYEAP